MLKIAHVGCGGMSAAWLESLADIADVELVALFDLRIESAEKARDRFAPQAFAGVDFDSFIKEGGVDAVFNCTIPEAHFSITMSALNKGCHVLTEKPLANSLGQAREMIQAARKQNRILAVIQNRRYQRAIRFIRRYLAEGKLGRLAEVSADFYVGPRFGGFREAMESPLLLDMAIHHFDMARFISGANPLSVFCHEWNPHHSWYSHGACAHAIFRMNDETVFNYRGSWCSDGAATSWNASWRIVGSKGTLSWDGENRVVVESVSQPVNEFLPKPIVEIPSIPEYPDEEKGHASLIQEFISCIRSGETPETAAEDNIHSLAMVFGAIHSSRNESWVDLRTLPDI